MRESEDLASELMRTGVPLQMLNAKNDQVEAEVVARAACVGAVTITTNMAGRGTDIRLGGPDERMHDAVMALGGLYIIGTNRHAIGSIFSCAADAGDRATLARLASSSASKIPSSNCTACDA